MLKRLSVDFSFSSFGGSRADARRLKVSTTHPDANSWPAQPEECHGIPFKPISTAHQVYTWIKCGSESKAHSEDLRFPSSGSAQCFQSSEAQQSPHGFCRCSICSIPRLKRPSGWWAAPKHQLHWMTGFVLPPTSHRLENSSARSHSNIYYKGAISISPSFFPQLHFINSIIADCQGVVRAVLSHQGQALLTHGLDQVKTTTGWMGTPDLSSKKKLQERSRWTVGRYKNLKWGSHECHTSRPRERNSSEILWELRAPVLGSDGEILPGSHWVLDK